MATFLYFRLYTLLPLLVKHLLQLGWQLISSCKIHPRSVSVLLYGSVLERHSQDIRRGRHLIPDNHRALMTPATVFGIEVCKPAYPWGRLTCNIPDDVTQRSQCHSWRRWSSQEINLREKTETSLTES